MGKLKRNILFINESNSDECGIYGIWNLLTRSKWSLFSFLGKAYIYALVSNEDDRHSQCLSRAGIEFVAAYERTHYIRISAVLFT